MDTAPPINSAPSQPTEAPAGPSQPPSQISTPVSPPPVQAIPSVSAVWPRSAQLVTAFLLGLASALIIINMWSMSLWSTRPLDLERNNPSRYRIDLNQADYAQLLQVPGIGDRTAEKIEVYRQEHGPFLNTTELTQIHGIGPAKFEKMSDWLTARSQKPGEQDDATTSNSKPRKNSSASAKESTIRPSKKEEALKHPIDVNRADAKELQKLPGIGPKMAQRVLDERAKAPFRTIEDLRRVSGIGPKVLERLRPFVKVGETDSHVVAEAVDGSEMKSHLEKAK